MTQVDQLKGRPYNLGGGTLLARGFPSAGRAPLAASWATGAAQWSPAPRRGTCTCPAAQGKAGRTAQKRGCAEGERRVRVGEMELMFLSGDFGRNLGPATI